MSWCGPLWVLLVWDTVFPGLVSASFARFGKLFYSLIVILMWLWEEASTVFTYSTILTKIPRICSLRQVLYFPIYISAFPIMIYYWGVLNAYWISWRSFTGIYFVVIITGISRLITGTSWGASLWAIPLSSLRLISWPSTLSSQSSQVLHLK